MSNFSYICIMWISICVVLLSAEPEISVSGPVGSTAVLPCELTSVDTDILYIRWGIDSEIVFERLYERSYQCEGYEGRVDVPMEELRKGNCSLMLHNLKVTDAGVYTSYQIVRRTKRFAHLRRKELLVSRIELSVYSKVPEESPKTTTQSDTARVNCLHPLVLVVSLLSCLL